MTNVSKHVLNDDVVQKLFKQFSTLFVGVQRVKMGHLFEELFTDTEKIMFIKRIGVVLMCAEGCSAYTISQTLHVSDTTATKIKLQFEQGRFDTIVHQSKRGDFDTRAFWKTVEVLLRGGLPSRTKDRWKYVPGMGG